MAFRELHLVVIERKDDNVGKSLLRKLRRI